MGAFCGGGGEGGGGKGYALPPQSIGGCPLPSPAPLPTPMVEALKNERSAGADNIPAELVKVDR